MSGGNDSGGKESMELGDDVPMTTDVTWTAVCPHNCITKHQYEGNSLAPTEDQVPDHLTAHSYASSASSDCYIVDFPDTPRGHGNSVSPRVLERMCVVSLLSHYITEEQMLAAFAASNGQPLRCPRVVPVPAKTVAKNKHTAVLDTLALDDANAIADIEEQSEQNMAALHALSMQVGGGSAPRRSQRVGAMDRTVVDAALDDQADNYEQQKERAHEKYHGFVKAALNPWNMHARTCSNNGSTAVVDGCNCRQPLDNSFHRFWRGRGPVVTFRESVLDAGVIGVGPDLVYQPPLDHAEIVSNHVDLIYFNKTPFNSPDFAGSPCSDMELADDDDEDV